MKKSLLALAAMLSMGVASATVPANDPGATATATSTSGANANANAGAAAGAQVVGSGNSNATGGTVVGSGNSNNDNRLSATGGSVGNVAGGAATNTNNIGTASGFNSRSLSPEANANSTNLNTNANTSVNTNTAAQGQQQGQLQGQMQGQAILGSGNSTNTVQGSTQSQTATSGVTGSGNSTIADGAVRNTVSTGSQSQSVNTAGTVGNVAGGSATGGNSTIAEGAVQNSVTNGSATSGNTQNITLNTFDPNSAATTRALGETEISVAQINAAAAKEVAAINAQALKDAASQKIRNTPSVNGPPLTSSNDTCMGSASGSVNVPGFGVGLGKTYTDTNCVRLKNSRELWNMGMKAAALALMCKDEENREALEVTGYQCPTAPAKKAE